MSRSLSNLAKRRAINLSRGLKLVIHQLHHVVPHAVGNHEQSEYVDNPSGMIDQIYSCLTCIDDDPLLVYAMSPTPQGSIGEDSYADVPRPLVSFLEETLNLLESKRTHSIVDFMRFYHSFQHRLLSMRDAF